VTLEKSFVITDSNNVQDSIYYYFFGNNSDYSNAYYWPQTLFYFPAYNIHHLYINCKYDNSTYLNYLSFIMIDSLITNNSSMNFSLNKNYLGELSSYSTLLNVNTKYTSSNNIFDLLYSANNNYNVYSTNLSNYLNTYESLKINIDKYNSDLNYNNDKLVVLNKFINLNDYISNYNRNNSSSYLSIENLITTISSYDDNISLYSNKLTLINTNLELLKEYTKEINDRKSLIELLNKEILNNNLSLFNNNDKINNYNVKYEDLTNTLKTDNQRYLDMISISGSVNSYINNYINKIGTPDVNGNYTSVNSYGYKLQYINTQITTYTQALSTGGSVSGLLATYNAQLDTFKQSLNTSNTNVTIYNTNLQNLLTLLSLDLTQPLTERNIAKNYLTNNIIYLDTESNQQNTKNIILDSKSKISTTQTTINNLLYDQNNNKVSLNYKKAIITDLTDTVYSYALNKWIESNGNDNIINRIYLQDLTLPNVPFFVTNRRFEIHLKFRILGDTLTQGILNVLT
jgi:hypothetical protein